MVVFVAGKLIQPSFRFKVWIPKYSQKPSNFFPSPRQMYPLKNKVAQIAMLKRRCARLAVAMH
jgi:hypothetical protein